MSRRALTSRKLLATAAVGTLAVGASACQPEKSASVSCVDGTLQGNKFTLYYSESDDSGFALKHRNGEDALRAAGAFRGVEKDLFGNETPEVGFVEGAEVLPGYSTGWNALGQYDDEELTGVTVSVGPNDGTDKFVITPGSAEAYSCTFPPNPQDGPSSTAYQKGFSRPATVGI